MLSSNELPYLPPVTAPDYLALVINPQGSIDTSEPPPPETVWVTSHLAGSSSVTVIRGCEGRPAQSWGSGVRWAHVATNEDYIEENLVVNGQFSATDPVTSTNAWDWNYSPSLGSAGTYSLSQTQVLSGFQSQKIVANSTSSVAFVATKPFPVFGDEVLRATAYTSCDLGVAATSGGAYLSIQLLDSSSTVVSTSYQKCTTLSTTWNRFELTVPVPPRVGTSGAGVITQAIIGVGAINPNPVGGVYFQNIVCTRESSEPFPIGGVMWWPATTPPNNFLTCDGSILNIQDYGTLFKVLGTQFGGNGTTTFGLPSMSGRVAIGTGVSPTSGIPRSIGAIGGADYVPLDSTMMPLTNPLVTVTNPTHFHSGTTLTESVQHTHTSPSTNVFTASGTSEWLASSGVQQVNSGSQTTTVENTTHTHSYTTNSVTPIVTATSTFGTSSPSPMPSIPPFMALTPCIRYR